ncbi:hypothetical protein ID866_7964, partial [Astraeus odoratus]
NFGLQFGNSHAAIIVYDYLLTFGREVDLYWGRPWYSWAFFLFVATRYLNVVGNVPSYIFPLFPFTDVSNGVCIILS